MEFALRGSGQPRPRMCGDGILWGWTWGEHAKGRPGILRAAWETFRLSCSGSDGEGTGVHQETLSKELEWPSVYRCLTSLYRCSCEEGPRNDWQERDQEPDSQQAVLSPTLSPAHSYQEKDSGALAGILAPKAHRKE